MVGDSVTSVSKLIVSFGERLLVLIAILTVKLLACLLCRVTVRGRANIPRRGRVLFLLNHRSGFGVFLLEAELFTPWVLWRMDMFPYNVGKQKHVVKAGSFLRRLATHFRIIELPEKNQVPGGRRTEVVQQQVRALTSGSNCAMVLFPTGTRDRPEQVGVAEFLPGVGRVVAQTLPQVVFVWDDDTAQLWPPGQKWPKISWRFWQVGQIKIPIGWRRLPVTITVSAPLDAASPETQLCHLCQTLRPEESGVWVAGYLHDLFEAWVKTDCLDEALSGNALRTGVFADLTLIRERSL